MSRCRKDLEGRPDVEKLTRFFLPIPLEGLCWSAVSRVHIHVGTSLDATCQFASTPTIVSANPKNKWLYPSPWPLQWRCLWFLVLAHIKNVIDTLLDHLKLTLTLHPVLQHLDYPETLTKILFTDSSSAFNSSVVAQLQDKSSHWVSPIQPADGSPTYFVSCSWTISTWSTKVMFVSLLLSLHTPVHQTPEVCAWH